MKKFGTILMTILAVGFMVTGSWAIQTNSPAPDFTLTDTNGKNHSLSDFKGKYVVLEWVNYECPFVKKHYGSDNMQKLQKEAAGKDVVWLSINSSAKGKQGYFEPHEVNQIMENSGAKPAAYLLDTDGKVGKTYGASTTPHMYVVDPEGNLIYQGAIDSNPSFDPKVIPSSTNYVMAALNAAMGGQAIENASTKSYGCSVKY